jgi:phosphonopyruvate decarboxylase
VVPAADLVAVLDRHGMTFCSGVPCSLLGPFPELLSRQSDVEYVAATHEGEAVALAAGAWLGGGRPVVFMQNSGLGNAVNPLTSLVRPYRMPMLLLVTWRGRPGQRDEPQHRLMGRLTLDLLAAMEVPHLVLAPSPRALDQQVAELVAGMDEGSQPAALVVEPGTVAADVAVTEVPPPGRGEGSVEDGRSFAGPPTRIAALARVLELVPDSAAIVSTTGKCSRELFTLRDRPQHFYQVGSMGSASAIGLAVARVSARPVVVLDGDGAALMRLGTMATIGTYGPPNLVHVVLDNQAHDSTGGQRTVSSNVRFAAVAAACGYRRAVATDSLEGLAKAFGAAVAGSGPTLIHQRIIPGSLPDLTRVPSDLPRIARRFRAFVTAKPDPEQ